MLSTSLAAKRGMLLLVGMTVTFSGLGASAWAQTSAQADDVRELLESMAPGERREAMRRLRETQEARGDSAEMTSAVRDIDDRFDPRPVGSGPESMGVTQEAEQTASVPRFGQSLFQQARATFDPVKFGPVPDDYRLGLGDELVVEVWGDVSFRDTYVVDRQGSVLLRDAGRAVIAGKTMAQAESEITQRLARVLSGVEVDGGGSTFVDVSLGRLRTIRVFVVGEARRPGGYEVSSASTVFQALYAAAGPNDIGSLREVRLIRDNRIVSRLDLYEYLLDGTREGDATLRDGDTVFIPVAERNVTIVGEVRRAAVFELRPEEGLRHALRMAGGLLPTARADIVHVSRIAPPPLRDAVGDERFDQDLPLAGFFDASQPVAALFDGDRLEILPLNDRVERYVSAAGAVVSPGRYGYERNMRVSDLLARAQGLWKDAILERTLLVRVKDDYTRESLPVNLTTLTGGDATDFILAPMDSLHVFSRERLQNFRAVTIYGAVRSPGAYPYHDGMTLQDLILGADGYTDGADRTAFQISRVDDSKEAHSDSAVVVLEVPLPDGEITDQGGGFVLQNHDNVFVRTLPGWELQRNVTVSGEVIRPGVYTLMSRQERLSSVIHRAGGLLESAHPVGFRLMREGLGSVGLDLEDALENPGGSNDIVLMKGDEITVPRVSSSVMVVGEVGHPTNVVYREGKGIGHYVDHAGGYARMADRGKTHVVYANGSSRKVRRLWPDPGVLPGSTVVVPAKEPSSGIDWGDVIVKTSQIVAAVATVIIATN